MIVDDEGVRLLLVEDDDGIARPLEGALQREGYLVERVGTGEEALEASDRIDALVLDLGLPDIDGLDVCRELRSRRPALPILVLTARTAEADIVVGLDAGADDYVTKPFRLAELSARLRAVLRRAEPPSDGVLTAQDVWLDLQARRAWHGDAELDLSPKEFELLALLVREAGRVVGRDRIMREIWDTTWMGSTKTIDMHVSWLRRKLGDDAASPRYLSTVRGVGLRFEAGR